MDRSETIRTLAGIAADQWGLVTTAQAEGAGVSRVNLARLGEAGLLLSVGRGVYQMAGAVPPEHLATKVAWLRLDPGVPAWQRPLGDARSGWVSHASACELHGIGDLPADAVQILVPRRRTTRDPGVRLRRAEVVPGDATVVDGLPVTTVERTICDLLADRVDAGHVGGVLTDADRMGLVDTRRLAGRILPYTRSYGQPHGKTGANLLAALAAAVGSVLRDQPPSATTTPGENARGAA